MDKLYYFYRTAGVHIAQHVWDGNPQHAGDPWEVGTAAFGRSTKLCREWSCWVASCTSSGVDTEPCVHPGTYLAFIAY